LKRKRYREDEFIQKTRLKDIKKFEKKLEGKTSDSESNSNLTEDDPAENNKELAEKLIANSKKAKEEEKKVKILKNLAKFKISTIVNQLTLF
jgi:hypothetical protein